MAAMPQRGREISLEDEIATVPSGAWAVAVSGGADSVALLHLLLSHRADLSLHIVHLDHETRDGESARDAEFVGELAASMGLPRTIARRSEIEPGIDTLPANRAARFRACRIEVFRRVVAAQALQGVILAHHADDQAETIMQRLLRGSGPAGLHGMALVSRVAGIEMIRPLLRVRRGPLRRWLTARGLCWREDASNLSPTQQRNRVRAMLAGREALVEAALELGAACAALSAWLAEQGGEVQADGLAVARLRGLPPPVARDLVRRWLAQRAGARIEITSAAVERLYQMAVDAASPARQHFPGRMLLRRRAGRLFTEASPDSSHRESRAASPPT